MALVYYNESELTNGSKKMRLDLSGSEKTFSLAEDAYHKAKEMEKESKELKEKAEKQKLEECIKHIQENGYAKIGIVSEVCEVSGLENVRNITFWF